MSKLKITKIETVHRSHLLMLRVHTDGGWIGSGETYYAPASVASLVHDWMSDYLLGANALAIEKHWRFFYERFMNFGGRGAEMRALSAIDLALWDIFGQSCDLPVWQLLGGKTTAAIPSYNSSGGTTYGLDMPVKGLPVGDTKLFWPGYGSAGFNGPLEDNWACVNRPADYAAELIREGYRGMKMWALDGCAHAAGGTLYSTYADLKKALKPLFDIRDKVGFDIELMLDGHGFFQLPAALRIAEMIKEIKPLWLEDAMRVTNVDTLKIFRDRCGVPLAVSEMFTSPEDYRLVLEKQAADYIMIDPTWAGGISQTKRIAQMASAYNIPVTMHDCTGPFTLLAGIQVGISSHNVVFQESVRAHLRVVYDSLIDQKIEVINGMITAPERAGIGAAWLPALFLVDDPRYRVSEIK